MKACLLNFNVYCLISYTGKAFLYSYMREPSMVCEVIYSHSVIELLESVVVIPSMIML